MKALSWNDITVQQFQDIYRLSLSQDLDEMTRLERVVCIMFDLTEQQVDLLSMTQFKELAAQCAFIMSGEIPGKPMKQIKVGKNRYQIVYDPTKLRHRQYVEVLHFGEKPIENMHLAMASLVNPVTWYGKKLKNKGEDHLRIADDLLRARVIDVYHSCVFFCNLYVNLIEGIKAYLVADMMKQGARKDQAITLVNNLQSVTAGCITPERLQLLKI